MQSDQSRSFLPCDWTCQNSSCCDIGTIRILPCNSTYQDPFHHAFESFIILLALQFDQSGYFSHPMDQWGPRCCSIGPIRILTLLWDCTNQNPPCRISGQPRSFLSYHGQHLRVVRLDWSGSGSYTAVVQRLEVFGQTYRYEGFQSHPFLLTLCKAIWSICCTPPNSI